MTDKENREAVVRLAKTFLGETDPSHFIAVYNNKVGYNAMQRGWPWCAAFACSVFAEAGAEIPMSLSCCQLSKLLKAEGKLVEDDGYIPDPGDLIFIDWAGSTATDSRSDVESDHVGIVTDLSDGVIYAIEGNRSSQVMTACYSVNDKFISGFGVPFGKAKQNTTPAQTSDAVISIKGRQIRSGSKGASVEAAQILLDLWGHPCGESGADGDFGPDTEKATLAFQTENGLEADGVIGPATWAALIGNLN